MLEELCVLIVYLIALEEAFLLGLVGLQTAGLDALVELFGELEVDLHALLPLRGVDGFDVGPVKHVSLYHRN